MAVVDLDRVFERHTGEDGQRPESSWRDAFPELNALTWPQLLEHRRVVLLAEASSGKTTEFRSRAEALRVDGKAGFFLDLSTLAECSLTACLTFPERPRFEAWRQSAEDAWFFLDAVDELRLTRRSLEMALNTLTRDLGDAVDRARVLLSSRVADWRGEDDLATLQRCLPMPSSEPRRSPGHGSIDDEAEPPLLSAEPAPMTPGSTVPSPPLVVRLKPLDRDRMGRLAAAHDVQDVETFLNAIAQRGLEPLAGRPGDLVMLATYWKTHRALGRPAQMMEALVAEKLRERNARFQGENDPTPERAREAVERIAAAMTLGDTLTIAPPAAADPATGDALDPRATLPELNDAQRGALLRLGVFAPETFGRIRFHHRTTQDYLTACWLRRLITAGREAVEDLVFASPHGIAVVRPALRAATAWLALQDGGICKEVTQREPRLLVEGGDPSSLLPAQRCAVLRTFVALLARGETNDAWIDNQKISLFAHVHLTDDIRALWAAQPNHDVRCFLLRLVRLGPITACAVLARDVLHDPGSDLELRLHALCAAEACGDGEALQSVAEHIRRDPTSVPRRHIAAYLGALVPAHLGPVDVSQLLRHATSGSERDLDLTVDALSRRMGGLTPSDRMALLAGVVSLLQDVVRHGNDHPQLVPVFQLASHLGTFLAPVLAGLGDVVPDQVVLDALALYEAHGDNADASRLRTLVEERPALKRALFWHDVGAARRRQPTRRIEHPLDVWSGNNRLWYMAWKDCEWLRHDVTTRPSEEDRALALTALVALARANGMLDVEHTSLHALARKGALEAHLERLLIPSGPSPEYLAHQADMARRSEEWRRREEEEGRKRKDFADRLKADADALTVTEPLHGEVLGNLVNLYNRLRSTVSRDRPEPHWRDLTAEFGAGVAERYGRALKRLWRITEPARPTWNGNTVTRQWVSVLSVHGLNLEATDEPNWSAALTDAELERALAHALVADSQLPPWVASVACARPGVSVRLLAGRLEYEWTRGVSYSPLLSALGHDAGPLLDLMRTPALWLFLKPARDLNRLDTAIRILRRLQPDRTQREVLAERTKEHLRAARDRQDEQMALGYLRLLFVLSPASAAGAVDAWLDAVPEEQRRQAAVDTLAALNDEIGPIQDDDRAASVTAIAALTRLAFRYVRPEDDNRREGAFWADERDNAERARGALFGTLAKTPGAEAHATLKDLLADDDVIRGRPWLRQALRNHALLDAERSPLRPPDVIAIERDHLAPIQSGDDLHRHVLRELEDIARGFQEADFSSRDVVATAQDETAVQTWLAERLSERSRGRWQVTREPEVADRKEPDICIVTGSLQMAIEVKLCKPSGRWSRTDLASALRDQLVGRYLRIDQRRHGCLVVINQGKTWEADDGTHMDFNAVLTELRARADVITSTQPVMVSVVGIEAGREMA
jgi:hypothetical protein